MEDDVYRLARQADNILTSEAFQKAMDQLETHTIEQWANGQFKTHIQKQTARHHRVDETHEGTSGTARENVSSPHAGSLSNPR